VKGPDAGSYFHLFSRRENRPLCKSLTCNKNEALSEANAITHLDNKEEQTDFETTNSKNETTFQAIFPSTQVLQPIVPINNQSKAFNVFTPTLVIVKIK